MTIIVLVSYGIPIRQIHDNKDEDTTPNILNDKEIKP